MDQVNEFLQLVTELSNNTRLWVNCGYTYHSVPVVNLSQMVYSAKDVGLACRTFQAPPFKVGRNEPCPCGSGKKYKKCCGGRMTLTPRMKDFVP